MASAKVEQATLVFQELGENKSQAVRAAHLAEQCWALCIRMDDVNLRSHLLNMSVRELAAIYGSAAGEGTAFDFRTDLEKEEGIPVTRAKVSNFVRGQGWRK
tara:strand:- start:214 stop:519 length:306 start_codon:yes stop_codon:yes gene_type:complete